MPERSSGQIRGLQIAEKIGGNFFNKNSVNIPASIDNIHNSCVFVRDINLSHARYLKRAGRQIAYDLLDRPVSDLHIQQQTNKNSLEVDWSRYVHDCIDIFIVNNKNCYDKLASLINNNQKIVIIPHHIITGNIVLKNTKKEIKNVGYLGIADQIHDCEKIKIFCNSIGLEFITENISEKNKCIDFLKNIDIGIVFINKDNRTDYVLKYKPNTKLTNFQAFGIPSVCCEYSSFSEFAPSNSFLSVNSTKDMLKSIGLILNNEQKRNELIEKSLQNAKRFTINEISKIYIEAFNT